MLTCRTRHGELQTPVAMGVGAGVVTPTMARSDVGTRHLPVVWKVYVSCGMMHQQRTNCEGVNEFVYAT